MKKLILFLSIAMVITVTIYAQAPQAFKYQAMVRNDQGIPLADQKVSIRVILIQGAMEGEAVYSEYHYATTNSFGLISLQIGQGDEASSAISDIDWSIGHYYIRLEMDEQGGSNYKAMGQSQLLSVPYALYAEQSGSGSRENDMDWGKRMNDKLDLFTGTGDSYPDGNVGIGTYIPKAKLEVAYQYGIGSSFMRVHNNPGGNSIFLMRRARGNIYSKTEVVEGDFIGQVAFEGYDGTAFKRSARMSSQVDGAVQPGIIPGNIIFHTRNTSGVMNEIIRFTSDGNVGIGTKYPAGILDIAGEYHFPDTDGSNGQVLQTDGSGTLNWTNNAGANALHWTDTSNQLATDYDVSLIDSSKWKLSGTNIYSKVAGNVGIGTTDPAYMLQVAGNIGCDTVFGKHDWDSEYNTPTTLSGYGITDARILGTWQKEVVSDNDNHWTISFTLQPTSIVSYNGVELQASQWSGSGTATLNVSFLTYKYDKISVIH